MFFIILLVLGCWILGLVEDKISDVARFGVFCILGVLTLLLLPISIWAPLHGFEEKVCVEEIELVALQDIEEEGIYFVERDHRMGSCTYAYSTKDEYTLDGETYNEKTVTTFKIYESADCTKPVLKVFESKAKFGLFSFGFYTKTEYVFFIPENTELSQ